jgi:ribose 5-phosphate isomerase B
MIVAVASDHAGVELKGRLVARLRRARFRVLDLGTHRPDPVDYPDYARALAGSILARKAARGLLICGSAVGVSVAANKFRGIRAAVCHDAYSARQGVEHDDLNVLCLGARVIGEELAWMLVETFLAARFSGEPRHRRRLKKVLEIEAETMKPRPSLRGEAAQAVAVGTGKRDPR